MIGTCIDCGRSLRRQHVTSYPVAGGNRVCGECKSERMYRAYYELS